MPGFCYFFYLSHAHICCLDSNGEAIFDRKDIGIYNTLNRAEAAMIKFRQLPGFSAYPDDFLIRRMRCNLTGHGRKADIETVYMPYHERYISDEDCDYVTRGNLYDNSDEARSELLSWSTEKGFQWCEEGANVLEFAINADSRFWSEGFTHGHEDGVV